MDFGLILLRLAHVVAGAAWVGGAFVMILLVTRTARLRGADGDAFMTTLLTQGKAARYFEIAAVTTVLAGGLLYFRASGGFQIEWITSPSGIGFTIGAVAAIVSLVWGGVVVGPAGKRAAAIEAEVAADRWRRDGGPYLRARRDPPQARHLRPGRSRPAGHGRGHDGDRALLVIDGAAGGTARRSRRTMTGNARQGDAPPMPHVATSTADLLSTIRAAAHLDGDVLVIDDETAFRSTAIRDLAWTAAFSTDEATTAAAQWIVWEASQALGAHSASIQDLYTARGRGEVAGFTVPAINLRAQTFDMARTAFEAAASADVGAVIFEIARSEQTYTYQRPIDFATSVLAGAIAAGWRAPVFIQGDHYQFNAKKYAADPEAMTEEIRRACRLAIDAGYRNIDIDSSTLVDLSKPTVDEQQRENYTRAAELTALIRTLETDGVTVSVGGEIGEVGSQNSNVGGVARLPRRLPTRAGCADAGRDRLSARSASRPARATAACRCPTAASPRSSSISTCCASSATSPGASTARPEPSSTVRPPCRTSCSTGSRPSRLPRSTSRPASRTRSTTTRRSRRTSVAPIEAWCLENAADERKPDQTDEQFIYTTRKKAIGPFKRELWDLETKDEILATQRRKLSFLFTELGVNGTREMITAYIRPVEVHRPIPDALREAVGAG